VRVVLHNDLDQMTEFKPPSQKSRHWNHVIDLFNNLHGCPYLPQLNTKTRRVRAGITQ